MVITNNQNTFFSIIVPSYNVEEYISTALQSIINQSFKYFEIIIVNDGSTDNTLKIAEEFTKQYSNITIINHKKNESLHMARLNGVAAAKGNYIMFLDADDWFANNALDTLYKIIQENPDNDMYQFGYIRQPSGEIIKPINFGNNIFSIFFQEDASPPLTMWNKAYKSDIIKKSFAQMEKVYQNDGEDTYESIVIAFYTKKVYYVDNVITNYRLGSGFSTTYKNYEKTIKLMQSIQNAITLIENFLIKNNIDINSFYLKQYLFNVVIHHINNQKDNDDRINLLSCLKNYINHDTIIDYFTSYLIKLYKHNQSQLEYNNRIKKSIDYKIGFLLLKPLRFIKHRLFKK